VAFLRDELSRRGMATCADLATARDGRHLTAAGLVLVRQRPGSASGVLFITLEDETGVANLVVWPSLFERRRRLVLSAGMIAARGRVQREAEVVHLIAEQLKDLSDLLRSVSERESTAPNLLCGCDGETRVDVADPRVLARARDIYIPDLRLGACIKVPTRDFR
jgi:error-prone DNA polymerase